MADLYGRSSESEDMSYFLQILVNSSSVAATTCTSPDDLLCGAPLVAGSSSGVNFSDPRTLFGKESEGISFSAKLGNFASSFEEAEASESRVKSAPPRSSKRSRAAEIHNLSEKRRRSRINEKLKALQNLVPNSSKTDKASMLDEAIEYLKQLQLQVQMLTMRNGLSLHPLGSTLVPQSDGGRTLHNSLEQEIYGQTAFETCNHASAGQPIVIPSSIINSTSQITAGQNNYGLVDRLASSKDIFRDGTPSRFQFDTCFSGKNSSPGVSS